MTQTDLLIVGAGPFGLALSAYASRRGMRHMVVGEPMAFWRDNMPTGMYLRSDRTWHLDADGEFTIARYLEVAGIRQSDVEPLPLDVYLQYCDWFCREQGLGATRAFIQTLEYDARSGLHTARLSNGHSVEARNVVLAMGMGYFENVPSELAAMFPPERFKHTREFVDCASGSGKRLLIIGGRQSAFEWAALLRENGAEAIHITYRHQTPAFSPSDWSWVERVVDWIALDPAWYRRLSADGKDELKQMLWAEGRLKLEPWLARRIAGDSVRLHPRTVVTGAQEDGELLSVSLSDGSTVDVHEVILATGYKVDAARIPFISAGNIAERLATMDGFPVLNESMESSIPGLYFTSACAAQDFGPFFGFTVSVRASAELIGRALVGRLAGSANAA